MTVDGRIGRVTGISGEISPFEEVTFRETRNIRKWNGVHDAPIMKIEEEHHGR
jgi:hypothetical protein